MADMEGEDMALMSAFGGRRASATLAGRRERETRPLARSDRQRATIASTKTRQLNLKVTAEFYERVAALARNHKMSMPAFVEMAVERMAKGD